MTLPRVTRAVRPYRFRLVGADGEPVMSIRGTVPLEFSDFDFACGIGMSRAAADRPVFVVDGLTGSWFDLNGNRMMR